jgi:hypothetical protein
MRKLLKNKRADITIVILVIGIFAASALTLYSFYSSTTDIKGSFVGWNLIEKINSISEENKFHELIGSNQKVSGTFKEDKAEIIVEDNKITGNYSVQECSYWIVGCINKRLIFIEHIPK